MNQLQNFNYNNQNSSVDQQSAQEHNNMYPQPPTQQIEFEDQIHVDQVDSLENQDMFKMEEEGDLNNIKSLSEASRNGFIVKVYGILTYQLLITALFIIAVFSSPSFLGFIESNEWLLMTAGILAIACQ